MKKTVAFILASAIALSVSSQKINSKLTFQQGQQLDVSTTIKVKFSLEMMGQAMDMTTNGVITDFYKITNSTDDNTTLHHENKRINFQSEGMGQNLSFDTDNEKDMKRDEAKFLKKLQEQKFDMIIDAAGKVLMVKAGEANANQKTESDIFDSPVAAELFNSIKAPQKGTPSFFKILPDQEIAIGDKWVDSVINESSKTNNEYTLTAITDSTIEIKLTSTGVNNSKADTQGMEMNIVANTKGEGVIILDPKTKIIKRKTVETNATGNVELVMMGQKIPFTSKTTTVVEVAPPTLKGF